MHAIPFRLLASIAAVSAILYGYRRLSRAGYRTHASIGLVVLLGLAVWVRVFQLLSTDSGESSGRAARAATEIVFALALFFGMPGVFARWAQTLFPSRPYAAKLAVLAWGALLVAIIACRFVMERQIDLPATLASCTAAVAYGWLMVTVGALTMSAGPMAALQAVSAVVFRRLSRMRAMEEQGAQPRGGLAESPADTPPQVSLGSESDGLAGAGLTRRQLVEAVGGGAVLATVASTFVWGTARGRFDVELVEMAVRIKGLPRTLDGYTLAQISDIHAGLVLDEEVFGRGFAVLKSARADLVVATGDLVDDDHRFAPKVAAALMQVGARDGAFAILGNHDYYANVQRVRAAVAKSGVRMLVNEGAQIRPADGGGFALLGIDDAWARSRGGGGPDLARALAQVTPDSPRIMLSHQPDTVTEWAGHVALQLSGHTHGGQYNPGFRPIALMTPYVAGRYEVGGTTLYVNRGLGTTAIPTRVGARPEITKIVLVAA